MKNEGPPHPSPAATPSPQGEGLAGEIDLKKVPFADWLEEAIPVLCRMKVECIGMVALLEDGGVATNYWNAGTNQLAAMGYRMMEAGILNTLKQNARELKEILGAAEDGDEGPEGQE